ncbi:hypothetical protein BLA29_004405 [Euroglyphus maynei]|uniref:Uncharacterized protein n=1 Tax=Euroglyphus maynei TaxID=6958 RepID=A0A1Y3BC41_EURMA|nr:hypothetical protein BLA29_004405 [Euroglyphus maynei]
MSELPQRQSGKRHLRLSHLLAVTNAFGCGYNGRGREAEIIFTFSPGSLIIKRRIVGRVMHIIIKMG